MRAFTIANLVIAVGLFALAMFLAVGTISGLWPDPPVATIAFLAGVPIIGGLAWLILEAKDARVRVSAALGSGWYYLACAPLIAIALVGIGQVDDQPPATSPVEQVEPSAPPSMASPKGSFRPVTWRFVGNACSDGTRSGSIGKQGACSHHGGVVDVYRGDNGQVLRCGADMRPPSPAEQQRQLRNTGMIFCTR